MSTLVAHEPEGGEATMHLFRDVTEAHELMARIRDRLAPAVAPAVSGLTRREIEVLRFLAAGVSTRGCADRLHVARATIPNHVQSILAKVGVHSRLEAVAHAHRHRLIDRADGAGRVGDGV